MALFAATTAGVLGSGRRTAAGASAETYNALGLAEYEAIEAFKRYAPDDFLRDLPL